MKQQNYKTTLITEVSNVHKQQVSICIIMHVTGLSTCVNVSNLKCAVHATKSVCKSTSRQSIHIQYNIIYTYIAMYAYRM